jgi:hypothetical protein
MQHANSSYVLNDAKFKKVSKGLKSALQKKMGADAANLSLQFVMQSLSKELFSIPYEEAKSTILANGRASILATPSIEPVVNLSSLIWSQVVDEYKSHPVSKELNEQELILLLSGIFIAFSVSERRILNGHAMQISMCLDVGGLISKTIDPQFSPSNLYKNHVVREKVLSHSRGEGENIWRKRALPVLSSLLCCLVERHEIEVGLEPPFDLKNALEVLELERFASIALDNSISIEHRAVLWTLLKSVNYIPATTENPAPIQSQNTVEHFQYVTMEFEAWINNIVQIHEFILSIMKK